MNKAEEILLNSTLYELRNTSNTTENILRECILKAQLLERERIIGYLSMEQFIEPLESVPSPVVEAPMTCYWCGGIIDDVTKSVTTRSGRHKHINCRLSHRCKHCQELIKADELYDTYKDHPTTYIHMRCRKAYDREKRK